MASLNTSIEGPAINKAYRSVVESPGPANASAASSPTYGQWAIFSVQAPLVSAFQNAGSQDSVLRVFRTGEGELLDMADEFSEGKIQYGFVRIKDPNTTLPKNVLIAWCGDGVPERTKGYYSGYTSAVQKVFQGYHVQINARTDADLIPETIVKKVQDASGSKYSGGGAVSSAQDAPKPPVASKPVFTPSRVGGGGGNFNPLGAGRTRPTVAPSTSTADSSDGWADAPQPTRSQLEKVAPAYQRTNVDMASLSSQRQEPSRFQQPTPSSNGNPDVVKGGYQPIGKVDIAAIRREAQEKGAVRDERPTAVKGSYEPVGKVDIGAIRARAQGPGGSASPPASMSPSATGTSQRSADNDAGSGRLSALPKPKPAGGLGSSNFTGTRAPLPTSFDSQPSVPNAQVGAAGRTFADSAGKTPAQQWAERRAMAGGAPTPSADTSRTIPAQTSGGGQAGGWQSSYSGKKWDAVQTTKTGASGASSNRTGEDDAAPISARDEEPASTPAGGVSAMRDRFKNAPIPSAASGPPPPMDITSKPNAARPAEETQRVPPPPPQVPRPDDEDEDEDEGPGDEAALRPQSPIRIARPIARTEEPAPLPKAEEEEEAPVMPVRSLERALPSESRLDAEPAVEDDDTARAVAEQAAAPTTGGTKGRTAIAQYDYEKAEDNEIELREGEQITGIDMVDDDWWMGVNKKGEQGLFPSNYVELVEGGGASAGAAAGAAAPAPSRGKTATAQYDYEAAEENELTFPEGAKITDVVSPLPTSYRNLSISKGEADKQQEFPDEDWWLGEFNGQRGLFPANYVELD
ncbi:MAG: hypothetical protein Q9162_003102 [Coniocarpon cinnabarinum]